MNSFTRPGSAKWYVRRVSQGKVRRGVSSIPCSSPVQKTGVLVTQKGAGQGWGGRAQFGVVGRGRAMEIVFLICLENDHGFLSPGKERRRWLTGRPLDRNCDATEREQQKLTRQENGH